MEQILIVDDEANLRLALSELLSLEGYEPVTASSGNEGWEVLCENPEVALVVTDMTMPNGSGLALLSKVKAEKPEVPVIMLTAFGTVELAVEAMKIGAFDYLTKPFKNDDLLKTIAKALELGRLSRQNKELRSALSQKFSFGNLIGKSKPMLELYELLEKVAPTKANVLITGESGTGKELVAQALHYNSPRSVRPFVAVNCSALSSSLLESELFGHEKGAFTDAKTGRAGRFEMASGGTLFLDEVGEMDHSIQVKLLRVLQERTFERVGGGQSRTVDVRLVTATNRDLKKEVAEGRFREDLFYRLNVVHFILPPLRDRLDDLPLLVEHFLAKYTGESGQETLSMSQEAMRFLFTYKWPGNVRELENTIERGVVLASGTEIKAEDLPDDIRLSGGARGAVDAAAVEAGERLIPRQVAPVNGSSSQVEKIMPPRFDAGKMSWVGQAIETLPEGTTLDEALSALEEGLIRAALNEADGVQSHAANALGLKKNVFKYKWDKYLVQPQASALSAALAALTPPGLPLVAALEEFEERLLRRALDKTGWVQSQAADLLGIKKNLMQYKLKKFDLKGD